MRRHFYLLVLWLSLMVCHGQPRWMYTSVAPVTNLGHFDLAADVVQGRDGLFYGATPHGGAFGQGTLFKASVDGTITYIPFDGTNGAAPGTPLQASDGSFYSIASQGGSLGAGTVYHLDTNGVVKAIYSFDGTNGSMPTALTFGTDGNLYGVAATGFDGINVTSITGIVFEVSTSGIFTPLASFGESNTWANCIVQGNDGNLYGTTSQGGLYSCGTVFRVTTDGQISTLVTFNGTNGQFPRSIILASDGALYGSVGSGGIGYTGPYTGWGNVFKVSTNGDFTILHAFAKTDGWEPMGRLLEESNGVFLGVTYFGGLNGAGTIYQISTNGDFATLLNFDSSWGKSCFPISGLTKGNDGNYYGISSQPDEIYCLRPMETPTFQTSVQNGQINFSWNGLGGLAYQLRYKTNLNDPYWTYLSGSASETNSVGSYSEAIDPSLPRFYTLRINIRENWWGLPPLTGPYP